jgi:hypothetical protein
MEFCNNIARKVHETQLCRLQYEVMSMYNKIHIHGNYGPGASNQLTDEFNK